MKLFLLYDFATHDPILNFLEYEENSFFFFISALTLIILCILPPSLCRIDQNNWGSAILVEQLASIDHQKWEEEATERKEG
jgi:hypothetical protein